MLVRRRAGDLVFLAGFGGAMLLMLWRASRGEDQGRAPYAESARRLEDSDRSGLRHLLRAHEVLAQLDRGLDLLRDLGRIQPGGGKTWNDAQQDLAGTAKPSSSPSGATS